MAVAPAAPGNLAYAYRKGIVDLSRFTGESVERLRNLLERLLALRNACADYIAGGEVLKYPFWPKRVYFEPAALQYPRGRELRELFIRYGVPVHLTSSHNQVRGIPGDTAFRAFNEAKQTLVIGKRRLLGNFQTCRPSAHYQLPLATGCPGRCCYCYLHTTLGKKPYLRAYINVEEILERAGRYIAGRAPETSFEGAAVGDPLFVEPFTGAVARRSNFFGGTKTGRFRLVTKFNQVGPFLKLDHNGHTRFRFSINSEAIIEKYEYGTRSSGALRSREKLSLPVYPAGFLIAPIFWNTTGGNATVTYCTSWQKTFPLIWILL